MPTADSTAARPAVAGGAEVRLGQSLMGAGVHRAARHHRLGPAVLAPGRRDLRDQVRRRHHYQGQLRSERSGQADRDPCPTGAARRDVQAPRAWTVQMPHRAVVPVLLVGAHGDAPGGGLRAGGAHTSLSPGCRGAKMPGRGGSPLRTGPVPWLGTGLASADTRPVVLSPLLWFAASGVQGAGRRCVGCGAAGGFLLGHTRRCVDVFLAQLAVKAG